MGNSGHVLVSNFDVDGASVATSIMHGLRELVALIDTDLRVAAVNAQVLDTLGWRDDEILGRPALDLIAADDRERAALVLGFADRQGAMPGSAPFGLLRADGTTFTVDITGINTVVENQMMMTLVGRPTYVPVAIGRLLDGLLAGHELSEVIEPLLDFFSWRENGSQVAISWHEDEGLRSVSTGLADPLTGGNEDAASGLWAEVRRTGSAVRGPAEQLLDQTTLELAAAEGLHSVWIEPMPDPSGAAPLVTVWAGGPTHGPEIHTFAVEETKRYVDLALRWHAQARNLEAAAHSDELTGLANRRAFFDELSSGRGGGAIFFADLDGFKAINDRLGHQAGDALLVEVARRIAHVVPEGHCVARLGGDEFAAIMRGVSLEAAASVLERIRSAWEAPFRLNGITVDIGISLGVAHDDHALTEATLDTADRCQYTDKRRRRRTPT